MDGIPPIVPFYHVAPVHEVNGVTVLTSPNLYLGMGKRAVHFPPASLAAAEYRVTVANASGVFIPNPNRELPVPWAVAAPPLGNSAGLSQVAIPLQANPMAPVQVPNMANYRKILRK